MLFVRSFLWLGRLLAPKPAIPPALLSFQVFLRDVARDCLSERLGNLGRIPESAATQAFCNPSTFSMFSADCAEVVMIMKLPK